MGKMKGWLKNGKIYSLAGRIKEKGKQIVAGIMVGVMIILAPLTFAGCKNTPPDNTDTSIVDTSTPGTETPGSTDTEKPGSTDTEKPGTETPGTENPGSTDTEKPGTDTPGSTDTETPGTETPGTDTPGTDNPGTDNPGQTPDVPPVEPEMTLQEFLAHNNGQTAKDFAVDIIDDMTNYNLMKALAYSLEAGDGNLTKVNVVYLIDGEGTQRKLMQAEINIVGGVEMEDVIAGTAEDFTTTTETTGTLLTFDAKEEANKGSSSTIQTQIEEAIDKAIGEDAETVQQYQMENFEVADVAGLAQEMPEQVNTVFNQHFLDDALKTGRFSSLDASKISNAKWILKGDKEITDVDFVFHYGDDAGKQIYVINLKFNRNLTIDEIINNASTLTSASTTRTQKYMFDYIPTMQGSRDDLVNALFKAAGVNEQKGTRYLKDLGQSAMIDGLEMAHGFSVVELKDDEIKEYTIYVNVANDDAGYVNKLKNSSEFKITNSQVVDITGASVEYLAQAAKTLSARTGTTKRRIITTADGKQFMI